ncbi:MAG: J domain-containing protein [Arcobacteraceae bacterium]
MRINYDEFKKSVEILGLISLTTKAKVKKRYLELSKIHHPDMPQGDVVKFQELNRAYEILSFYMDNFRYTFSKEEFEDQFPFGVSQKDWIV